jgi:uncharacterized protein YabN with tetrapyrrole methylase and pyrophosphatase domain
METMIRENGDDINSMNLAEMDVYWDKAKKQLKTSNL